MGRVILTCQSRHGGDEGDNVDGPVTNLRGIVGPRGVGAPTHDCFESRCRSVMVRIEALSQGIRGQGRGRGWERIARYFQGSLRPKGGEEAPFIFMGTQTEDPSTTDQEGRSRCRMRVFALTPWPDWSSLGSCPLSSVVLSLE